ncbi:MAG: ATP-binding protein [Bacteroidetes bacterium]|nr:ATP-binding protein [Bacteroidota bacterium]
MSRIFKYHGHTWTLIIVGVLMPIVASAIIMIVPNRLAKRELAHLDASTTLAANILASRLKDDFSTSSSIRINEAVDLAKGLKNLTYLVITDESGAPLGGINEAGAVRLGYEAPTLNSPDIEDGGFVQTRLLADLTDSTTAIIHLGMTDASFKSNIRKNRQFFLWIGFVLVLLSVGIFVSIHQINQTEGRVSRLKKLQQDLSQQKGTLESKVNEQQKTEAELKESEQRYRYLLENAMESAFADLEALNKNLERQKSALEIEVEERTKAQISLAKYADRLTALNVIERLLVSEDTLDSVVRTALEQTKKLLGCDRVEILQVVPESQELKILGSIGTPKGAVSMGHAYQLSSMRQASTPWLYIADLRSLNDQTEAEAKLVKEGMVSYGRAMLTIGDTIVGAIIVSEDKPEAFSDGDITSVRDVADLISIALGQHKHREDQERYEQELITERDRAEEMARLKTAFLANMSHEIRTPLSGIIGFAQVLHEEVHEDLREFTGLIQDASNRLLNTINSVLDLSKLEANKESFRLEEVDVSSVVRDSLHILTSLAVKKGIDLRVQTQPRQFCNLDKNGLQGIVNNLVGNAIKFTEQGHVEVSVSRVENEVCLKVEDTGVGISKNFIPFLYDEFRQEHMEADRSHEGSGLGLTIAHKLIVRQGGRIEVDSIPERGTTFTVYFPCAHSPSAPKGKAVKKGLPATA